MWSRTNFVSKSLLPLLEVAATSAVDRYTMAYALEALRLLAVGTTGTAKQVRTHEVSSKAAQAKARRVLARLVSENECIDVQAAHFCMGSSSSNQGTAGHPETPAPRGQIDLDQLIRRRWCPRTDASSEF
jgi:hypothetical protein